MGSDGQRWVRIGLAAGVIAAAGGLVCALIMRRRKESDEDRASPAPERSNSESERDRAWWLAKWNDVPGLARVDSDRASPAPERSNSEYERDRAWWLSSWKERVQRGEILGMLGLGTKNSDAVIKQLQGISDEIG